MIVQWQAARKIAGVWWPALVGALIIAGPSFMLGQCSGVQIQKDRQAIAEIPAIQTVGRANTSAATERAAANHTITAAHEEQSRAIQSAPDERPSAGRLRRACVQLRQQGAERLPPECRSEGGG